MDPLSLASFPAQEYDAWLASATDRYARGMWIPLIGEPEHGREQARRLLEQRMPDGVVTTARPLLGVHDGGRLVGWIWMTRNEDDQLAVVDAVLDPGIDPLVLQDLVAGHFRDQGMSHLLINPVRGSDVLDAWAASGGYEATATTMVLDLSVPIAATGVALAEASQDRFDRWRDQSLQEYAAEVHDSTTMSAEAALAKAHEDYQRLLPDGLSTADQHFLDVRHGDAPVALLWIGTGSGAFVYDIVVDEPLRGRGLGRATMNAAAHWCRDRGHPTLGLTVWGQNAVARRLYDSLGYEAVQRHLAKPLS